MQDPYKRSNMPSTVNRPPQQPQNKSRPQMRDGMKQQPPQRPQTQRPKADIMNSRMRSPENLQYTSVRSGYSYNRGYRPPSGRRRHRRPTPFLVIITVFIIILLAVIFTSKSFKGFIDGFKKPDDTEEDTSSAVSDTLQEQIPKETDTEPEDSETVPPPEDEEFLICIDPGHGFGDAGSTTDYLNGLYERDINLAVAVKVYDFLKDSGYNVILSHNGEEFPVSPDDDGDDLYYIDERVSYANSQNVDLFVSIHCDTFPDDESVYGTRIYYCTEYAYSDDAEKLADLIKSSVNETFPKYKDAKLYGKELGNAYYVTAYTNAPSALIELGFISNKDEAAKLLNEEWQSEMAFAISNAISVYINQNVEN